MRPKLTLQDVLSKAGKHMLRQRVKSCEGEHYSAYHADDGKKCPVGVFLNGYDAALVEGIPVGDPNVQQRLSFEPTPAHIKLLEKLQLIHDIVPPKAWCSRLNSLANAFKLGVHFTPERSRQ